MRNVQLIVWMLICSSIVLADDPILLDCIETPAIYDLDLKPEPLNHSNNLRRRAGSPDIASGKLIHIVGRITDTNCLPVQNAVVFIWHTDAQGMKHDNKQDPQFAGMFITNNLGYYNFITIMPGKSDDRVPHINFLVQHPDFPEFTTQMFFVDHNDSNYTDPVLKNLFNDGLAKVLIAPFLYNSNGIKTYIFNITFAGCNRFSNKR